MNRSQTLSYTSSAISIYHNKNGGAKIVHVKEGLTAKRIWEYENIKLKLFTWKLRYKKANGV